MSQYDDMKKQIIRGWNTWNTRSVLSHVHMPEGFAVNLCIKDASHSDYMKEADVGRKDDEKANVFPKAHAYDGSYTKLRLTWNDTVVDISSASKDDELYLLVEPVNPVKDVVTLVAETGILWNRPGMLGRGKDGIKAVFDDRTFELFTTGTEVAEPYALAQAPYIAVRMKESEKIGFTTGSRKSIEDIEAVIAEKAEAHEAHARSFGDYEELYKAMQTCLAWDTVYDPLKDRVVSTVSRRWNKYWSGYVLFCWDNYFASQLAAVDSKEIAYSNLIEITNEQTENGFVPNYAKSIGICSEDRSQPPVGASSLLAVYKKWGEKWIVEQLFPALMRWNDWWFENRQVEPGLFAWGSDPFAPRINHVIETIGVNERFGAALESGLDNSPMYDDIPFDKERHMLELADVGLTGLVIMDCHALIGLADILGDAASKEKLEKKLALCEKAIQRLWCEEDGFFYNLRTDTHEFSKRIAPTNFYALYSSTVTPEQSRRMIEEHFYNPDEFWGEYIMPSIARNDPGYPDQTYWRGRIWAPLNFLVYGALKGKGLDKAAADLAEKSGKLILKEWLEKGHVHENYCGDTGEGCNSERSDPFYHWGGLLSLIVLKEAGIA